MIATVTIAWGDIDAPLSQHPVLMGEGAEQQSLMQFLLREGQMLAIAVEKVRRWHGKPLPTTDVVVHKSSIHTTTATFRQSEVGLTFKLSSSQDQIAAAKWQSSRDCPRVGEWISPRNTDRPVMVMGYYVHQGRRNVIYALPQSLSVEDIPGIHNPRMTIGTVFGRDWS